MSAGLDFVEAQVLGILQELAASLSRSGRRLLGWRRWEGSGCRPGRSGVNWDPAASRRSSLRSAALRRSGVFGKQAGEAVAVLAGRSAMNIESEPWEPDGWLLGVGRPWRVKGLGSSSPFRMEPSAGNSNYLEREKGLRPGASMDRSALAAGWPPPSVAARSGGEQLNKPSFSCPLEHWCPSRVARALDSATARVAGKLNGKIEYGHQNDVKLLK
jgi:hypothetical protein